MPSRKSRSGPTSRRATHCCALVLALVLAQFAGLVSGQPGSGAASASAARIQAVAIGDSVMLGAVAQLGARGIAADAVESRQWATGVAIAQSMAASHRLTPTVVIHLGTNGPISSGMFDQMMGALSPARHVLFLTMKEPRFWEAGNNAVLAAGVRRWHKARLVDWHAAALAHPGWTWGDGIHLTPAGAVGYANLVAAAVHAVNAPPAPKPVPHIGSPESVVDGAWKRLAVPKPLPGKSFCSADGGCMYTTSGMRVQVLYDAQRNGHAVEFDVGGYTNPGNAKYWRFLLSLLPSGATKPTCKSLAHTGTPLNGGPAKACVYKYQSTTILVAQALGGSTAFPGEGIVSLDGVISDIMPDTPRQ